MIPSVSLREGGFSHLYLLLAEAIGVVWMSGCFPMLFFLVAATIHSLFSLSLVLRSFMCFQGFKKKKNLNWIKSKTLPVPCKIKRPSSKEEKANSLSRRWPLTPPPSFQSDASFWGLTRRRWRRKKKITKFRKICWNAQKEPHTLW